MAKPTDPALRIGLSITLIWAIFTLAYFIFVPDALGEVTSGFGPFVQTLLTVVVPLALIWTVVLTQRALTALRKDSAALRQSLESLKADLNQTHPRQTAAQQEWVARQLADIAVLTEQTENRISELTLSTYEAQGKTPPPRNVAAVASTKAVSSRGQGSLPLETKTTPPQRPITVREFIRALNFPQNADDKEGFRILRRALSEHRLGKLIHSAQDVLTFLSELGIYMDDLKPDPPKAAIWRKFAREERGLVVASLGGIRDQEILAKTKAKLKSDPIFRDASHHFLRRFDLMLKEFEKTAEDFELDEMTQTRTARAFMLLGRISGAFA